MKIILKLIIGIIIMQCIKLEAIEIKDSSYPLIAKNNTAVILVDFPDTPQSVKDQYPTLEEAQEYFCGEKISSYFSDISYGKMELTGKVFGYFTMPNSLTEDLRNNDGIINFTENYNLELSGYSAEDFDTVVFVIFHHEYEQGGLSAAGFANFTMNGVKQEKRNVVYIGASFRDGKGRADTYEKDASVSFYCDETCDEMIDLPHPCGLKYLQAIFIHEFIHQINGYRNIPHANSSTNNGAPEFAEPNSEQPEWFLDLEYGNGFDIMAGGRLALSLNAGYRKLCGWLDSENSYYYTIPGTYNATIFPINRKGCKTSIEIRTVNREKIEDDFPGYFIELREPDRWDAALANEHLLENTKGVLVYSTDGFKTKILDMSPSPNSVNAAGNHQIDYRDMGLKEGMEYENRDLKLHVVTANSDGSYTIEITIKNNIQGA